jgi:hypothetical protein
MGKKSSETEVEARVGAVYKLLLQRETNATIYRFVTHKWGVSERQAQIYIQRARDRMMEELKIGRQEALAEHLALRRDLYSQAVKLKQPAVALQVAGDEAKLRGLYYSLDDHLRAVLDAGYQVYEPDSPEDQAANQDAIAQQTEPVVELLVTPEAAPGSDG